MRAIYEFEYINVKNKEKHASFLFRILIRFVKDELKRLNELIGKIKKNASSKSKPVGSTYNNE